MTLATSTDDNRRYAALGRIAEASTHLENAVRSVYCALIGSKYAAVVAAGMSLDRLISGVNALLNVHREISEGSRDRLRALVAEARTLNQGRKVIHHVWLYGDQSAGTMIGPTGNHKLARHHTTIEDMEKLSSDMQHCAVQTNVALFDAVGMELVGMDAQLRWEEHIASMSEEDRRVMAERRAAALAAKAGPVG